MKIEIRKYARTIVVLIIICSGLVILSFLSDSCIKERINEIFSWISGLSTLITLAIALILFEKYGLNKKITEKKQDIVLGLLDELSKSILIIETSVGKGGSTTTSYHLDSGVKFVPNKDYNGKILLFSDNYPIGIDRILKYSKSYWMPLHIQEKLNKACLYFLNFSDLDPFDEKYVRVKFSTDNDYFNDKNMRYGIMNKSLTIDNYFQKWEELHNTIIEWLNKNADFELNRD
jgi:hypothetical protein